MGSNMKEMDGRAVLILFMMLPLVKTEELSGFVDKDISFPISRGHSDITLLTVTFNGKEIAKSSNISKEWWNDFLLPPYGLRLRLNDKNETSIVLKSLRLNDTGVYWIHATFKNGTRLSTRYNLTVYAPEDGKDTGFLEGPAAGDLQDKTVVSTPDEDSTKGGSGTVVALDHVVLIAVIIAVGI